MTTDEIYREFARRRHRMLAVYAALQAWQRGVECVWVEREDLAKFLGGLERVNMDKRIEPLKDDVSHWFPHVTEFPYDSGWLARIVFSRVPMRKIVSVDRPRVITPIAENPELEKIFQEFLPAKGAKMPLPKHGLTEAAVTSILHRLSIGLSQEES